MPSERTAGALGLAASLAPIMAALVASAMLVVDTLRPVPVFCAESGGCHAVRQDALAAPFGVPLPFVGLAGFLALGAVSLLGGARARKVQLAFATGAAMVGVALLIEQVRIGHFCPYCCVVDGGAVASAIAAGWRLRLPATTPPPRVLTYAGAASMAVAVIVPLVLGFRASGVPRAIREELARAPKGATTVVDFVDFECPFCRMTHADLEPLLDAHKDKIHLVRKQVPLTHIHPHALDAARAACCGERLGKGDAMANALFAAPVDDLTREGCEKLAEQTGLALLPYRACVADPAIDAQIQSDRAEWKAAGGFALPTVWIGEHELVGMQPSEVIAQALDDALAHAGG